MAPQKLQKLPIGVQSFEQLRTDNYLYVDKTEHVYNLATNGIAYFYHALAALVSPCSAAHLKHCLKAKKIFLKVHGLQTVTGSGRPTRSFI